MNIGKLKKLIKDLPDNMPFGLLDLTTDDPDNGNYSLKKENFEILDYCKDLDNLEITGKGLFVVFENKLNENPI